MEPGETVEQLRTRLRREIYVETYGGGFPGGEEKKTASERRFDAKTDAEIVELAEARVSTLRTADEVVEELEWLNARLLESLRQNRDDPAIPEIRHRRHEFEEQLRLGRHAK